MQQQKLRAILIVLVLLGSLFYIYPTVGWMTLSQEEREALVERQKEEKRIYAKPSVMRDAAKALKRWAQFDRDMVINLGLDLQGGIHMVLGLDMDSVPKEVLQEHRDQGASEDEIVKFYQLTALRIIERRANEFEAKEPLIQAYGSDQIQIQLPGEKDIDRARNLIMQTAQLTFHAVVLPERTEQVFSAIERKFPRQFLPYLRQEMRDAPYEIALEHIDSVREVVKEAGAEPGLIPDDMMIAFSRAPRPWDDDQRYRMYLLEKEPLMTGDGLRRAYARPDANSVEGFYHIQFEMDTASGRKFGEVTEKNIGRYMAIVVDGVAESAPVIKSKITTNGEISGSFSAEHAKDLAIALNSGSMPAKLREEFMGVVGATLGADSVRKGVTSAIAGLVLVVLFMVVYYRMAGIIANIGLVFNAALILAALAYFNATLTLPGIAGLILTIGMAVDANVLIFERIREEIRNGRSLLASIDTGFVRARVTILDANITTLIAAAVLLQFGTGPIEGFAVTLSIGVCSSVFTALVVTRALFDLLANRKLLGKLTMMSIMKPETKIGFLGKRHVALIASAVLIVGGLAMFGVRSTGQLGMFGVDFTTGTNMIVNLHGAEQVDVGQVRAMLAEAGFKEPIVQEYEQEGVASLNRFLIRIPDIGSDASEGEPATAATSADGTVAGRVQAALAPLASPAVEPETSDVETERVETVGPAVGKQLKIDASLAILYAIGFIILYLWFRFELKFALGAVAALIHDVLVTVGLFALFGRQITLPVVAALLTIIGYSLNDTIVVFDRIREDLRLYRGRGLSYTHIMDLSINQTLSRTLLTSVTTLIVVLVLFFAGGDVINDFAFALIAGIIVGTYSSIFVASPVVYYFQKLQGKQLHPTDEQTKEGTSRRRKSKKRKGAQKEGEATV